MRALCLLIAVIPLCAQEEVPSAFCAARPWTGKEQRSTETSF